VTADRSLMTSCSCGVSEADPVLHEVFDAIGIKYGVRFVDTASATDLSPEQTVAINKA
jgi:hypothetical protein